MILVVIVLACLGLILGSFVNALVWRVREQDILARKHPKTTKTKNARSSQLKKLSILNGRSMCPSCHHELAARDLVPLFSWLFLGGKCRYCQKPISWQYPLVEVSTAGLFVFSYYFWPLELSGYGLVSFVVWLAISVGFVALFIYDLRWYQLPTRIIWPLAVLALAQVLVHIIFYNGGWQAVYVAALGVIVSSGLFYLIYRINDEWIGDGDYRLGVVIGLLIGGFEPSFLMIFLASTLGTLVSLPGLIAKKLDMASKLPFGPYLIIATSVIVLFGQSIIHWLHAILYLQ